MSQHSAFSHTLPHAGGRNAPARRRPRGAGPPPSAAAAAAASGRGSDPFGSRPPSAAGGSSAGLDGSGEFDFEQELAAIGRMNKAEKAAQVWEKAECCDICDAGEGLEPHLFEANWSARDGGRAPPADRTRPGDASPPPGE
eukprot:gene38972-13244_t